MLEEGIELHLCLTLEHLSIDCFLYGLMVLFYFQMFLCIERKIGEFIGYICNCPILKFLIFPLKTKK